MDASRMRHHAGLYFRLLRAQMRGQLAYRASFALDLLATTLLTGAEFAAFALVMARFPSLGGWSFAEVALLYGLAEFSFALMDILFGGFDAPNVSENVRRGLFDQLLLRPVSLTLQVFASDFALRRLGRLVLGLGILAYALTLHPIAWDVAKLALLPLSVLGLVLFFGGLFMIGGTITFWTVQSVEAMNVLTYGGRTLISYPLTIYAEWLRKLLTFALPAAFLSYFPALYLLDRPFPPGFGPWAAWCAPLAGAAVLAAATAFWRFGVQHYQGTGT